MDDVVLAWCPIQESFPPQALTPAEQHEFSEFKSAGRRQEYLATRGLINRMVDAMGLDSLQFELQKNDLGKPWGIFDGKEYPLSIAHTAERVICAISSKRELGVDLEPASRTVPDKLRDRIINEQEALLLKDEPAIRIWTLKEALVKLEGKGMRTNLNECIITAGTDKLFTAIFDNDKKAKICSFLHENNWLAVAWNSK